MRYPTSHRLAKFSEISALSTNLAQGAESQVKATMLIVHGWWSWARNEGGVGGEGGVECCEGPLSGRYRGSCEVYPSQFRSYNSVLMERSS